MPFPSLPSSLQEDVIDVPVRLKLQSGLDVQQPIKVTLFRDPGRPRAPYLVLHHGRPAHAADFASLGRIRYPEVSAYFVSLGFAVLVPTRVGYGASGGPDVEQSGPCADRNYPPVFAASGDQTVAVLAAAASGLPGVDTSRGIVVGQSFGGMTSIAVSSRPVPGLMGAVNFAGGAGGNPASWPGNPCGADRLTALCESYGRASRVPTLWLYSANDRYWGTELPRRWFQSFVDAGGRQAQFVQLPAHQEDGHSIFSAHPDAWKASFEAFLRTLGFLAPGAPHSLGCSPLL